MTRWKKLLAALAAVAGSLVAADVLLSLTVLRDGIFLGRPLPPFGAVTHPKQLEQNGGSGIGSFDPELGWTWLPSTASADGLARINALGARGPSEYGTTVAPGKRRILFFGDSFTFCDEVPDDAAFEWIIEKLDPRYEALNFGVSGYGTDQALLRYRKVGKGLGAEVVVIGYLLENVGRNVNRYRPLWYPSSGFSNTKPRFVLDPAGTLELLPQPYGTREELRESILDGSVIEDIAEHEYWLGRPRVPTGRLSAFARIGAGYLAYKARSPERLLSDSEGEPFRVTVALLERFQREALEDGARWAPILLFATKEDLRDHASGRKPYWKEFVAELERRGLAVIDVIDPLAERARELAAEKSAASLFFGGHLSKVGNAVVAHEILAWLETRPE